MFAALGAGVGGLFGRNAASSGAAIGALVGAVIGEKRVEAGSVRDRLTGEVSRRVSVRE